MSNPVVVESGSAVELSTADLEANFAIKVGERLVVRLESLEDDLAAETEAAVATEFAAEAEFAAAENIETEATAGYFQILVVQLGAHEHADMFGLPDSLA